jgi:hypothetical protein
MLSVPEEAARFPEQGIYLVQIGHRFIAASPRAHPRTPSG